MSDNPTLFLNEAHRRFAIEANNATWQLIEQPRRSSDDNDILIRTAHTSLYHWLQVGEGVHFQRGYWLLSHIYSLLNKIEEARYYADKCLVLTKSEKIELFDQAYCYEALSRVAKISGNDDEAHAYQQLALDIADEITDDEDKTIFINDMNRA